MIAQQHVAPGLKPEKEHVIMAHAMEIRMKKPNATLRLVQVFKSLKREIFRPKLVRLMSNYTK